MCHISQGQIPFSGTFISVKYVNLFVCHDINIGHSCLKKLKFQTKGHNHAGRSEDKRQRRVVAMMSCNAPEPTPSHLRLLRQLDL